MIEEESRYKCAECGKPVIVFDGVIYRACEHLNAAVTAECSATATGEASLESHDDK